MKKIKMMLALLAALVCGGAWANAVQIWDGTFTGWTTTDDGATYTKTIDGVAYTLSMNGHKYVENGDRSYLLISENANSEKKGVTLTRATATSATGATVIIDYSNYGFKSGKPHQIPLMIHGDRDTTSDPYGNTISVFAVLGGKMKADWADYYTGGPYATTAGAFPFVSDSEDEEVVRGLALTYGNAANSGGYAFQRDTDGTWREVYKNSTVLAGKNTYNILGFAVGGQYQTSKRATDAAAEAKIADGMKIYSIAVDYTPIRSVSELAWSTVTTPDYFANFDYKLALQYKADGSGAWSEGATEPSYTSVRGNGANGAAVMSNNTWPTLNGHNASGDFSYLTVAKIASSGIQIIGNVSDAVWEGNKNGLSLVFHDSKVKLVNWRHATSNANESITDAMVVASTEPVDEAWFKKYHTFLVVYKNDGQKAKLFIDGELVGTDWVTLPNRPGYTSWSIGRLYGGTGKLHFGEETSTLDYSTGMCVDAVAFWKSDMSESAAAIATKYPVWTDEGYVAQVGATGYTTLSAAVTAASANEVVEILSSCTDAVMLTKNVTFKVDGNVTLTGKISGAFSVTKTGNGILTFSNTGNDFSGGLYVKSGTVKGNTLGNAKNQDVALANQPTVHVSKGATLDIGATNGYSHKINLAGSLTATTGISNTSRQTESITLTDDAIVFADVNFGLLAHGYRATALNLGTHTLTINMSGNNNNNSFWLGQTTVSGTGTLYVEKGKISLNVSDKDAQITDGTLVVGKAGEVVLAAHQLKVKNLTLVPGASIQTNVNATKQLIVTGVMDISAFTTYTTAVVGASNASAVPFKVENTTRFRFPAGLAADTPFTLCTGTLDAPASVSDAVCYIGDTPKIVNLSYDTTNKTVSYSVVRDTVRTIYYKGTGDWNSTRKFYNSDAKSEEELTVMLPGDTVSIWENKTIFAANDLPALKLSVEAGINLIIGHNGEDQSKPNLPEHSVITIADGGKVFFAFWNNTWTYDIPMGDVEINGGTFGISPDNSGKVLKMGNVTGTSVLEVAVGDSVTVKSIARQPKAVEGKALITTHNDDGTTTYTAGDPVAKIGNVLYASLATAFEAANDDETITLMANVTGDLSIPTNKKVDAGTYTISGEIIIAADAELTVSGNRTTNGISGKGTLILASGTLNAKNKSSGYAVDGTTIQLDGGTFKAYTGTRGAYGDDDATLKDATIVFGGGELSNYGYVDFVGDLTFEVSADRQASAFSSDKGFRGTPNIIKNGTGNLTFNLFKQSNSQKFASLKLSGGSFKIHPDHDIQVDSLVSGVANKAVHYDSATKTYSLVDAVAKVVNGETTDYYETVQQAINAVGAANVETIELIGNPVIPEGYMTENGHVAKVIAKIVETMYSSLSAAMSVANTAATAVANKVTVVLQADSSENANISEFVTLDTNKKSHTGSISGTGKYILRYTGDSYSIPASPDGVTDTQNWTGTVWLIGDGTAENATDLIDIVSNPNKRVYSNANSKFEMTGLDGYFKAFDNRTVDAKEVILTDVDGLIAYVDSNGGTGKACLINKLSGTGTLQDRNNGPAGHGISVKDASEFAGSINLSHKVALKLGVDTQSSGTAKTIEVHGIANLAPGATWTAASGITVKSTGTLKGSGTLASATTFENGATIDVTGNNGDAIRLDTGIELSFSENMTINLVGVSDGTTVFKNVNSVPFGLDGLTVTINGNEDSGCLIYDGQEKSICYSTNAALTWVPVISDDTVDANGIFTWSSEQIWKVQGDTSDTTHSWPTSGRLPRVVFDANEISGVVIDGLINAGEVVVINSSSEDKPFVFHNHTKDVEGDSTTNDEVDCLTATVNLIDYNGELGLRVPIKGAITFGDHTSLKFLTSASNEEGVAPSTAYGYQVAGHVGSIKVEGDGKFRVDPDMYRAPFAPTANATLVYDTAGTVSGVVSGSGKVLVKSGKTDDVPNEVIFSGDLTGNAIEVESGKMTVSGGRINKNVKVASNAELQINNQDCVDWNATLTFDVAGTITTLKRQSIGSGATVILRDGGNINGTSTDGQGDWEYIYSNDKLTIDTGATATICRLGVRSNAMLTINGNNSTLNLTEGRFTNNATTSSINISLGVTVKLSSGKNLGIVKGAGTILADGWTPAVKSGNTVNNYAFADEWTGMVLIKNLSNCPLDFKGVAPTEDYNGKIGLSNVGGWIQTNNRDQLRTFELINDSPEGYGLYITGIGTGTNYQIGGFSGAGTFKCADNLASVNTFYIGNVANFTGKIAAGNKVNVVIGGTSGATISSTEGTLEFLDGAEVNAAAWTAKSVVFGANLTVHGSDGDTLITTDEEYTGELPDIGAVAALKKDGNAVKISDFGFKATNTGDEGTWTIPAVANTDIKTSPTTKTRTISDSVITYTFGSNYTGDSKDVIVTALVDLKPQDDNGLLFSVYYNNSWAGNVYYSSQRKLYVAYDDNSASKTYDTQIEGLHIISFVLKPAHVKLYVDGSQVIDTNVLQAHSYEGTKVVFGNTCKSANQDHYLNGSIFHTCNVNVVNHDNQAYENNTIDDSGNIPEDIKTVPAAYDTMALVNKVKLVNAFRNEDGSVSIPGAYSANGGALITDPAEIREMAAMLGDNDGATKVDLSLPIVAPAQTTDANTFEIKVNLSQRLTGGKLVLYTKTSPDGEPTEVSGSAISTPAAGAHTFSINSLTEAMGEGNVLFIKVKAVPLSE